MKCERFIVPSTTEAVIKELPYNSTGGRPTLYRSRTTDDGPWLSALDPDLRALQQTPVSEAMRRKYLTDSSQLNVAMSVEDYFKALSLRVRVEHLVDGLALGRRLRQTFDETYFTLKSWTLAQYQGAVADGGFLRSVRGVLESDRSDAEARATPTTQELVDRRFYLAGGCARRMSKMKYSKIVSYLQRGVKRAAGLVPLLTYNVRLTSPLLALYGDHVRTPVRTLVSIFALRAFVIEVGPGLILRMTFGIRAYPALDVFAFEAFILASGKGGMRSIFDPSVEASKLVLGSRWDVPSKWIPGGYDAVIWKEVGVDSPKMGLVFVQRTPSKQRHRFRPEPFVELLAKVRVAFPLEPLGEVELRYIVPSAVHNTFNPPLTASDFQQQVVDVAFGLLSSAPPAAATDDGTSGTPSVKCTLRVVGVEYPDYHLVANARRD